MKYNKFRASAFDVSKETDPEIIALYYKGIEDVKRRKAKAVEEAEEARKIEELSQKIREENGLWLEYRAICVGRENGIVKLKRLTWEEAADYDDDELTWVKEKQGSKKIPVVSSIPTYKDYGKEDLEPESLQSGRS